MIGKLLKAYRYAKQKHQGQTRKHGTPYFNHPKSVARLLWEAGERDLNTLISAVLHDTIEDCGVTQDELKELFGDSVAKTVKLLTKTKAIHDEDYYFNLSLNDSARKIKLADRIHNNSELHLAKDENLKTKADKKTKLVKKYCIGKKCRVTLNLCLLSNTTWG